MRICDLLPVRHPPSSTIIDYAVHESTRMYEPAGQKLRELTVLIPYVGHN